MNFYQYKCGACGKQDEREYIRPVCRDCGARWDDDSWRACCDQPGPLHADDCQNRLAQSLICPGSSRPVGAGSRCETCGTSFGYPHPANLIVGKAAPVHARSGPPVPPVWQPFGMVTSLDLEVIRAYLLKWSGADGTEPWTESLICTMTDEFGWSTGGPLVQWEEGPYDWAGALIQLTDLKNYLTFRGLYADTVRGWILAVYPI